MAGSVRVGLSYLFDWMVVICFAGAGAALTYISGFHRPFSLTDDALAYPLIPDIVSLPVVAIISLVGPAAVIGIINLTTALIGNTDSSSRNVHVRRRERIVAVAWETHAGWLGLCASLALTLSITAGLKDLIGKPRPDLLARCDPDLTNIDRYIIGGLGMSLDSEAPPFVTSAICQQLDKRLLDDGFAAFPSGHASFNSAGMVYLTLWLCARWRIAIPSLLNSQHRRSEVLRAQASLAAPPLWQLALALTPVLVALFVCSSRYADFHHAGIDIFAGAVLGTTIAWASFRLYHLPLRRSQGLVAWGPRSHHGAFTARGKALGDEADEEQARRTVNVELDSLRDDRPARVQTSDSVQPILADLGSRPQHGETHLSGQRK